MRISTGWATEFARKKFGVELDDENDLPKLVIEAGLDPADVLPRMTVADKYLVLRLEAERISMQAALAAGAVAPGSPDDRSVFFDQERSAMLTQWFPARYGPPVPVAAGD